ncbi:MAG: GH3 auxin-responsive promoter, partial [Desulfotomaculales bacterium]
FFGLSSVLVRIGEEFTGRKPEKTVKPGRFGLLAWSRLLRGLAKSRLNSRSILPKDVWNLKGIICAGTDTAFYKERIEHYWGKKPVEIYGGTEIGIAATQTWDHEGMVLFPDANYWEFIPEEEYFKTRKNPVYVPQTVLTNELEPGKRYEIVVTNFRGGAFLRYRVGDFIKVLALKNERLGIDLPQIIYEDRADDVIDLAGFTRITERTLWDALKKAGITHGNWVAKKSFPKDHPVIELYLETNPSGKAGEVEESIHQALRQVDADYHDLEEILGYRPVKVVPVPEGFFKACRERQRAASAGDRLPEHFSRINPPDGLFKELAVFRAQKQIEGGQRRS